MTTNSKNGHNRPERHHSRDRYPETDQPVHGPGVFDRDTDTTAFRESEKQCRNIIQNIPAAVVVHDIDTRILSCNSRACDYLGLDQNQIIGKSVDDAHWQYMTSEGEPMPRAQVPVNQVIATHKSLKDFTMGISRPGQPGIRWFVVNGNPVLDDGDELSQVIITFMDITAYRVSEEERERLEQRLVQTQKLEAIGTLAGGIAHDFNNILSGIFGYAHLAELNLDDPEKAKKNLSQIIKGAQRAAGLVHQILTYSRQADYEKRPLSLYLVVKEALKLLRSTIPATIEIEQQVNTKAEVMADPTQIHQVIMNLCTNAFQAMRDTGGVMVVGLNETRVTDKDSHVPPGHYLKLTVKDTGIGMDKATLEKIFDPYFTTKDVGEGTGLGLSTVFGIVDEHEGFIRVESNPGKGSSFNIFLPVIDPAKDPNPSEPMVSELSGGKESIMIVDDEADILDSSRELLEDFGYRVTTSMNGPDALTIFQKDPMAFDLVITDMTMPKMTGVDLSKRILEIRKDMPIILCTGYSDHVSRDRALAMGIRKYINKPASGKDIVRTVRDILDTA